MILFRNSIAVFLNNAANPDLKSRIPKIHGFQRAAIFDFTIEIFIFFTEYGRWSSLLISPLSFMILFLNSIAHF